MMMNIRAKRDGDWVLHLQSVTAMLPYFFVTNKTNYTWWMPFYILAMIHLPEFIKSSFRSGEFSVKQKASSFNGIWNDMATEKKYH